MDEFMFDDNGENSSFSTPLEQVLLAQNPQKPPTPVDHYYYWNHSLINDSHANPASTNSPSNLRAEELNSEREAQPQQLQQQKNNFSSVPLVTTNQQLNSIPNRIPMSYSLGKTAGVLPLGPSADQNHSIECLDFGSHSLNERDVSNMEPSLYNSEIYKIRITLSQLEKAPTSLQESKKHRKTRLENLFNISNQLSTMVDELHRPQKGPDNVFKLSSKISSKIVELTNFAQDAEIRNELQNFGTNVATAIECAEEIARRVKNDVELFEKVYKAAKDSITKIITAAKSSLESLTVSYCEMSDGNKYKISTLPFSIRWYTKTSQLTRQKALPCCDNQNSKPILSTSTDMTMLVGLKDPVTIDSNDDIIYNSSRGKLFLMQDAKSGIMIVKQLKQQDMIEVPEDKIRSFTLLSLTSKVLYFLAYQSEGEYEIVQLWRDITHFKVLSPRRFGSGDHKIQIKEIESFCFTQASRKQKRQEPNEQSSQAAKKRRFSKTSDVNPPSSLGASIPLSQCASSVSYPATTSTTSTASTPASAVLDGIAHSGNGCISSPAPGRSSTTAPSYSDAPVTTVSTTPYSEVPSRTPSSLRTPAPGFASSVVTTHSPEYTSTSSSQSVANGDIHIWLAPGSVIFPAVGSLVSTRINEWTALAPSNFPLSSPGTLRIHGSPTPQPPPEQLPVQRQVPPDNYPHCQVLGQHNTPVQYTSRIQPQYPARVQSPYQVPPALKSPGQFPPPTPVQVLTVQSPTPGQYPARTQPPTPVRFPPPTPVQVLPQSPAPVQYAARVQSPLPTIQVLSVQSPAPVQYLAPVQSPPSTPVPTVQSPVQYQVPPAQPPTPSQLAPTQIPESPAQVQYSDSVEEWEAFIKL